MTATAQRAGELPSTRRRGAALEEAILAAAYSELTEVGYQALTVEAVAARAHTGKASIYRRWPSKPELVLDALFVGLPSLEECGLGPVALGEEETTAEALYAIARATARVLAGPAGDAIRAIKFDWSAGPELSRAIDVRFQDPRRHLILGLLRRGVERGEVRPDAVCDLVADVIPAVLTDRLILQREPVSEADLGEIINQVIIPLVQAR